MDSSTSPTDRFCSICQTEIGHDDSLTFCPGCQLPFHEGCWNENRGCSAYGCAHVNVLRLGAEIRIDALPTVAAHPGDFANRRFDMELPELPFPWEFLLLVGTVLAAFTSLVLYGIPSLLSGAATVFGFWMIHLKKSSVLVLVLSLLFSWVGFVLGVISSTLIWQEGVL
jgi:PHD zinc finger-containing protein